MAKPKSTRKCRRCNEVGHRANKCPRGASATTNGGAERKSASPALKAIDEGIAALQAEVDERVRKINALRDAREVLG